MEQEKLDVIVEAANRAPSGGNYRGLHLLIIRDPAILRRMAEIATTCFAEMTYDENTYQSKKNSINRARNGFYEFYCGAPLRVDYVG